MVDGDGNREGYDDDELQWETSFERRQQEIKAKKELAMRKIQEQAFRASVRAGS